MLKPDSLRQVLTAALPALQRDPGKLAMFIPQGRVESTGTLARSWLYRYTLSVMLLDFEGHADAVIAPIVLWLARQQPELFANPDLWAKAVRFEVDFLTSTTVDMEIQLDLTEAVLMRPREGTPGALNLIHKAEPTPPELRDKAEHWELWLRDKLLAEWDYDPRLPPHSP